MNEIKLAPPLQIPIWFLRKMFRQVSASPREEVCGLLAGDGRGLVRRCYPIENILHRADRFKMETNAQFRALLSLERSGHRLLAIYHSHPGGPSHPSETDLREFFYPEAYSIIWSQQDEHWQCKMYYMDEKSYNEVDFRVIHRL